MNSENKICPFCAEKIKAESVLCRYCGNSLKKQKHCPFCAEKIKVKAVKCRYCRSDLEKISNFTKNEMGHVEQENVKLKELLSLLPGSPEIINQVLLDNADNIKLLFDEKTELEASLKFKDEEIAKLEQKLKRDEEERLELVYRLKSEEDYRMVLEQRLDNLSNILLDNTDNINNLMREKMELENRLKSGEEEKSDLLPLMKDTTEGAPGEAPTEMIPSEVKEVASVDLVPSMKDTKEEVLGEVPGENIASEVKEIASVDLVPSMKDSKEEVLSEVPTEKASVDLVSLLKDAAEEILSEVTTEEASEIKEVASVGLVMKDTTEDVLSEVPREDIASEVKEIMSLKSSEEKLMEVTNICPFCLEETVYQLPAYQSRNRLICTGCNMEFFSHIVIVKEVKFEVIEEKFMKFFTLKVVDLSGVSEIINFDYHVFRTICQSKDSHPTNDYELSGFEIRQNDTIVINYVNNRIVLVKNCTLDKYIILYPEV